MAGRRADMVRSCVVGSELRAELERCADGKYEYEHEPQYQHERPINTILQRFSRGRRDSNPQPAGSKPVALSIELRPHDAQDDSFPDHANFHLTEPRHLGQVWFNRGLRDVSPRACRRSTVHASSDACGTIFRMNMKGRLSLAAKSFERHSKTVQCLIKSNLP